MLKINGKEWKKKWEATPLTIVGPAPGCGEWGTDFGVKLKGCQKTQ